MLSGAAEFGGFQFGYPHSLPRQHIDDVLYTDKGDVEFSFQSCPPKQGSYVPITQADINRVIQILRVVDAAQTNR